MTSRRTVLSPTLQAFGLSPRFQPSTLRLLRLALAWSCLSLVARSDNAAWRPLGITNVFLILLENHDWAEIKGGVDCPYINQTLLPAASLADHYFTPTNNHPSLPNYLWLVAGTNFGILNDSSPVTNTRKTTNHLGWQLDLAGLTWRSYAENLPANVVPLSNVGNYAPRHVPLLYFKNINTNYTYVTNHFRPFEELARDLDRGTVARFNFITPNLTNDMHNAVGAVGRRKLGDNWLAKNVPKILKSDAWKNGGLLMIAWDEGSRGTAEGDESDGPLGLIVLAPTAKGHGYVNHLHYDHSSTLRTIQDIFGLQPYLGAAASSADLSDLFIPIPQLGFFPDLIAPTHFQVSQSYSGRVYSLEMTGRLGISPWEETARLIATGTTLDFPGISISGTNGSGFRFYRCTVQP